MPKKRTAAKTAKAAKAPGNTALLRQIGALPLPILVAFHLDIETAFIREHRDIRGLLKDLWWRDIPPRMAELIKTHEAKTALADIENETLPRVHEQTRHYMIETVEYAAWAKCTEGLAPLSDAFKEIMPTGVNAWEVLPASTQDFVTDILFDYPEFVALYRLGFAQAAERKRTGLIDPFTPQQEREMLQKFELEAEKNLERLFIDVHKDILCECPLWPVEIGVLLIADPARPMLLFDKKDLTRLTKEATAGLIGGTCEGEKLLLIARTEYLYPRACLSA